MWVFRGFVLLICGCCTLLTSPDVSGKPASVIISWSVVHWHPDLKAGCGCVTGKKQFDLQTKLTSQDLLFLKVWHFRRESHLSGMASVTDRTQWLRHTLTWSNIMRHILNACGSGISVGIATGYGMEGPGSNPGGDEIFRPSDRPWGPPSLL